MAIDKIPDDEVFLRNARGDEFGVYAALVAEADALHHGHVPSLIKPADHAQPAESEFFATLQDPKRMLGVAVLRTETGPVVVGLIQTSLITRDEGRAHKANTVVRVELVVVTESMRRLGIGRMLITRAKQWAVANRANSLTLDSYAFNIVAARLYRKASFDVLKKTYTQDFPTKTA